MYSHNLNLALCKGHEVQNMSTMHTLAIFFKYSPKRQRRLEQSTEEINIQRKRESLKEVGVRKVKLLCETRRVERHTTLEEFREMYEVNIDCLTAISKNEGNKWSSETMTDAFGLLCVISSSAFMISCIPNESVRV